MSTIFKNKIAAPMLAIFIFLQWLYTLAVHADITAQSQWVIDTATGCIHALFSDQKKRETVVKLSFLEKGNSGEAAIPGKR